MGRLVMGIAGGAVIGSFVGAVLALIGRSSLLFIAGVIVCAVIGAIATGGGWPPRPGAR